MFKQRYSIPNLDDIGRKLGAITDVLREAGVVTAESAGKANHEITRFEQNVMGYAAGGAPFGHLEMEHAESNTLLTLDIAFDVFYNAEYRRVTAEKIDDAVDSKIDYVQLNRDLALAAGLS
jgi:hypothetical protein